MYSMPRLITLILAALTVLATAAAAPAQYYTQLRYDMRYGTPDYVPSGSAQQSAPTSRADPYAFGAPQFGNYAITGNVRFGKSFQGNVPYNQQGSQLSTSLPSLRLSNFARDSFGVEDIGTQGSYGGPEAFFPGSASVTNAVTAQHRFAAGTQAERAGLTTPNLNRVVVTHQPPVIDTSAFYGVPLPGEMPAEGTPAAAIGVTVPRGAMEFVEALMAGRAPPSTMKEQEDGPGAGPARLGIPPAEEEPPAREKGPNEKYIRSPYNMLDERVGRTRPGNIYSRPGEAPSEAGAADQPAAVDMGLYEAVRREAGLAEPSLTLPAAPPPTRPGFAEEPRPGTPSAKMADRPGTAAEEPKRLEPEIEGPQLPAIPGAYQAASTYAVYTQRGHAAMKDAVYEKAEALFAAAGTLEPDRAGAFFGRTSALLGARSYAHAATLLERELPKHADWLKGAPDLKTVFGKAEVYGRIIADLKKELVRAPDNAAFNFLLGYVQYVSGDKPAARPFLEAAAKLRGAEAEYLLLKAMDAK